MIFLSVPKCDLTYSLCVFIREHLHTSERRTETREYLEAILGGAMLSCDIEKVGSEITACSQASCFLPSAIKEDTFVLEMPNQLPSGSLTSNSVSIMFDNSLSPAHTLVQIICQDHKGLLYDIMRTLKEYNIQVMDLNDIDIL